MASIYDRENVQLRCPKCSQEFGKRVSEVMSADVPCPACGTSVPIGNLTELVLDAVSKRLDSGEPDSSGMK